MDLRPELLPPAVDEAKVERLAELAAGIDGAQPGQWEDFLAEFNASAGTTLTYDDFQGIYGGQDHDTWVRKLLSDPHLTRLPDIHREELVELVRRVMEEAGPEHEIDFYLGLLELNIPDPRISDLIYWPGEYFGEGHPVPAEMTPEQVIDTALERAKAGGTDQANAGT